MNTFELSRSFSTTSGKAITLFHHFSFPLYSGKYPLHDLKVAASPRGGNRLTVICTARPKGRGIGPNVPTPLRLQAESGFIPDRATAGGGGKKNPPRGR